MTATNRLGERCEAAEATVKTLERELAFYKETEKGKLLAAYIRLRTFVELVSDFCDDDSAGHMKYLHSQAEIAMEEAGEP